VVVASEEVAKSSRSPIKARIVASATSGVAPKEIFIAPVTAVQKVLAKAEIGSPGTMQAVIKALKEKQVIIKEGVAYRLYDVFLEHYLRYFG
ncbi:hypothetical protein LCGC14_2151950, partial [marine sediment metagenome]